MLSVVPSYVGWIAVQLVALAGILEVFFDLPGDSRPLCQFRILLLGGTSGAASLTPDQESVSSTRRTWGTPRNDRLLGIYRAHLRCLCWGDLEAGSWVNFAEPNPGGFGVPRTQGFSNLVGLCRFDASVDAISRTLTYR